MAKQLDAIVIVDLESTCWEGAPPEGQISDIIEIGVCLLDLHTFERSERRGILVEPTRSTISPFCTQLTTLEPSQFGEAVSLADACRTLKRDYQTKQRAWASYGDYDRRQFERCCGELGVGYPFGPTHLNVKSLLALTRGLKREVGMAQALALLNLPLEGTHHRGVDDAWNIAAILGAVLRASRP